MPADDVAAFMRHDADEHIGRVAGFDQAGVDEHIGAAGDIGVERAVLNDEQMDIGGF